MSNPFVNHRIAFPPPNVPTIPPPPQADDKFNPYIMAATVALFVFLIWCFVWYVYHNRRKPNEENEIDLEKGYAYDEDKLAERTAKHYAKTSGRKVHFKSELDVSSSSSDDSSDDDFFEKKPKQVTDVKKSDGCKKSEEYVKFGKDNTKSDSFGDHYAKTSGRKVHFKSELDVSSSSSDDSSDDDFFEKKPKQVTDVKKSDGCKTDGCKKSEEDVKFGKDNTKSDSKSDSFGDQESKFRDKRLAESKDEPTRNGSSKKGKSARAVNKNKG